MMAYLPYNYLYKSERVFSKKPYKYRRLTGCYSFGKNAPGLGSFWITRGGKSGQSTSAGYGFPWSGIFSLLC